MSSKGNFQRAKIARKECLFSSDFKLVSKSRSEHLSTQKTSVKNIQALLKPYDPWWNSFVFSGDDEPLDPCFNDFASDYPIARTRDRKLSMKKTSTIQDLSNQVKLKLQKRKHNPDKMKNFNKRRRRAAARKESAAQREAEYQDSIEMETGEDREWMGK